MIDSTARVGVESRHFLIDCVISLIDYLTVVGENREKSTDKSGFVRLYRNELLFLFLLKIKEENDGII